KIRTELREQAHADDSCDSFESSFPRGVIRHTAGAVSSLSGLRAQGMTSRSLLLSTASQPNCQCFEVNFVPNTAAGQLRILTGFPYVSPQGSRQRRRVHRASWIPWQPQRRNQSLNLQKNSARSAAN